MTAHPKLVDYKDRSLRARRVDLRPFSRADVTDRYRKWLMDPETVRFLDVVFADRSMPALEVFADAVVRDPNRLFFMVVVRETGQEIGTANLQIDPVHRLANYGYMIGERDWWGTPAPLEAQVALFDFAFDELMARRFYAGVRRDNVMSQFNLKRLGFVKEGVFRQHVRAALEAETYMDAVYYGLLRDEWYAVRGKFDAYRYGESV